MVIGLIRHFKVDYTSDSKYFGAGDFSAAMERYENSPIIFNST